MGSGPSREEVIISKWLEAKSQKILRTSANIGKVEVICSLLPIQDEKTAIKLLKARPDLDTLFALHYRDHDLSEEQRANLSLTLDFKANELWRTFRMPLGCGEAPWDGNWQPPLSGSASEIADEFHAAVCRAVFRIPFVEFVKWSLECDALFVRSLFDAVCEVRDQLQWAIHNAPETMKLYLEVEKVSQQLSGITKYSQDKILRSRHLKLAHWIVASSCSKSSYPLDITLDSMRTPLQNLFATCNFNLILKRLPVFDQRWKQIDQSFDWENWSMDLDFWNQTCQALWLETPSHHREDSDTLQEALDEKMIFLGTFESFPQDRAYGRRLLLLLTRFQGGQR